MDRREEGGQSSPGSRLGAPIKNMGAPEATELRHPKSRAEPLFALEEKVPGLERMDFFAVRHQNTPKIFKKNEKKPNNKCKLGMIGCHLSKNNRLLFQSSTPLVLRRGCWDAQPCCRRLPREAPENFRSWEAPRNTSSPHPRHSPALEGEAAKGEAVVFSAGTWD